MESICVMFSLVVIGYLGSAKTNWRWDFLWFDNDAHRLTEEMVMADDWIVVLLRFMQLLKTNTSNGRFFSIVIAKFVLLSDENDEMELVETNVVFSRPGEKTILMVFRPSFNLRGSQ